MISIFHQRNGTLNINKCPDCRRAMRLWALSWRKEAGEVKRLCLRTAIDFRSGMCFHNLPLEAA